jgi:hypothetical protein
VPAHNFLTIETSLQSQKISSVSILSLSGQVIKNETFVENPHCINIQNLNPGMYLLNVAVGNYSFPKIFVKQ